MNELDAIDPQWAWQPMRPSVDQPWNPSMVAHLYRRAGFGVDGSELVAAADRDPEQVVSELIDNNVEPTDFQDTADALTRTVVAGGNPQQLSAAWVYRLMFTPRQLLEKLTLFWHGHFATSADKVQDARMMWNQNQLLRDHALGDFAELTQMMAKDPAMLIYLDSAVNRKAHPNENFARELMELFCLGEGNYSEQDVQELSRCFTGWEVKNGRFRKNRYQHDGGRKSVLGHEGELDGEDGIRLVLAEPSLEMFLAGKWFRYFVADEPVPPPALLKPIADVFRQHDLQVAPVLKVMLSSNLFFSQHAIGKKIKSPVEYVVGMLRSFRATTNTQLVARGLQQVGQGLFYPPNVKGWDGGRDWINSSTLLGRSNLIADILADEATRFNGASLVSYLDSLDIGSPDAMIDHFQLCSSPVAVSAATRQRLLDTFASVGGDRERKLRTMLHAFMTLPQCQLG